jgi:hypothetical protein
VAADGVPHPPPAELIIGADHDGLTRRGPHGQLVVPGARQPGRAGRRARVTPLPEHARHGGIHVVIKEESH